MCLGGGLSTSAGGVESFFNVRCICISLRNSLDSESVTQWMNSIEGASLISDEKLSCDALMSNGDILGYACDVR
jgi:hypothetical protein